MMSQGPWRLAKTSGLQHAMSNQWLAEAGSFSLFVRSTKALERACSQEMNRSSSDPHARWCRRVPRKVGPYPDRFVIP